MKSDTALPKYTKHTLRDSLPPDSLQAVGLKHDSECRRIISSMSV